MPTSASVHRPAARPIWARQVLLAVALLVAATAGAADSTDPLAAGFADPPNGARPRVWWHWINGNVTREGIRLDLEWMKRTGLGGFQNFDAALGSAEIIEQRLAYMTPEWKDAFHYAMQQADSLGLEAAIAGSPGWSESGGPWVEPSHGMKKLVWSETAVRGGVRFQGLLPKPPTVTGPFQDQPIVDILALVSGQTPASPPEYYADSAVVAYREPAGHDLPAPTVTTSGPAIDATLLTDGGVAKFVSLPIAPVGQTSWIEYRYPAAQTVRAVTFASGDAPSPLAALAAGPAARPVFESSRDGRAWKAIVTLPVDGAAAHTVSFAPVTARYFRVSFTTRAPEPARLGNLDFSDVPMPFGPPPADLHVAEFVLHADGRVNRVEEKAGFATLKELYSAATPTVGAGAAIARTGVLDLTGRMTPDGRLDWTPPPGRWRVLRFGYSLTGVTNHPATAEATGLEVDKLNPRYVRDYMEKYLDTYKSAVPTLMGAHGLNCVINDSYEAGQANWTEDMLSEFARRRGYDAHPWLPVLTGRIVAGAETSDRFLWDFRKTLAELIAENHYDLITKIVHERGLCHYGESHEDFRAFVGDGMEAKRSNDVPMGAMWMQRPGVNERMYGYEADIRESASVAHLYGQNIAAAESMTAAIAPWGWSPALLKPTADAELLMGLNRFVIHTSVHQPETDRVPGLGLGPFGQWFTRNETWAEQARPWIDYLARNSFLLQQGRFVADVAYFYGEDSNVTALFGDHEPAVPTTVAFDFINVDALVHLLSVENGELSTPSGMRYRVLALDALCEHMSLPVLRKIRELVAAGATVSGPKPTGTPSLADDALEYARIADELWPAQGNSRRLGKGIVYRGLPLAAVLAAAGVEPDLEVAAPSGSATVRFVHRRLADGDLYFVANRSNAAASFDASFRVAGREAQLWHADSGAIEPASFAIAGHRTTVPLTLEPWGTVVVVFRQPTSATARTLPQRVDSDLGTLEGPWDVAFAPNRGAPASARLAALASWSDNSDPGIRYFSGSGSYTHSLDVRPEWLAAGRSLWLDLGDVENLAEVSVNGTPLGVLWKPPFRVDITRLVHAGANSLAVKVTDLWVNRIIGDRQPGVIHPITFTEPARYKADSPLVRSGLLGPVRLIGSK